MTMKFTHNGKDIPLVYPGGNGQAKLYAVPETYSDDSYYVAVWADGEMEPIPACQGSAAKMLCHVRLQDNDGRVQPETVTSNGATCHA